MTCVHAGGMIVAIVDPMIASLDSSLAPSVAAAGSGPAVPMTSPWLPTAFSTGVAILPSSSGVVSGAMAVTP